MFFDFDEESRPLWIYLIYITAYLVTVIYGIFYVNKNMIYRDKGVVRSFLFILFFSAFAVFYCINSDYFNYRGLVIFTSERRIFTTQQEQIYQIIAELVKGNYELFRLIVWGGAIVLTAFISKLLKVPVFMSLLVWFILYYDRICYARASLAMALFYMGITIMVLNRKQLWKVAIGITICLLSIMFHRSMLIAAMSLPIVFMGFSRRSLWIFGFFIILGSLFMITILNNMPDLLMDEYQHKFDAYNSEIASGRWERHSLKNYASSLMAYGLFYIPLYIVFSKIRVNASALNESIYRIFLITVTIIGIATAFWFYYGFNNAYFYRVLYMTAAPISILLVYMYNMRMIKPKVIKNLFYYSIIYHLLYLYTTITTQGIS